MDAVIVLALFALGSMWLIEQENRKGGATHGEAARQEG